MDGPKWDTTFLYPDVPLQGKRRDLGQDSLEAFEHDLTHGSSTCLAMTSASMIGMLWGGEARMDDTVDLPVAIPPVRPTTGQTIHSQVMTWSLTLVPTYQAC
jgi:hypothetical protein